MDFQPVIDIVRYSSLVLDAVGIILILYGGILSMGRIINTELAPKEKFQQYENTKRLFIQKIILALDFFVAAELIRLVLVTDFNEVATTAVIVLIRTVLGWSLSREAHLHKD